jgi:hypothetical protein
MLHARNVGVAWGRGYLGTTWPGDEASAQAHKINCCHTCIYATDINLQNLCLEKLSSWLKSSSDVDTLPLPTKLKIKLNIFIYPLSS